MFKSLNAIFLILAFGTAAAAPSPVEAVGDLRDVGVDECAYEYYGVGQPIDYQKAYACFEQHKIYEFLIPMQINGQGVPASLDKAKGFMSVWLKADSPGYESADQTSMQDLLKFPGALARRSQPVDFCKDIAGTTPAISFCAQIQDSLEKQDSQRVLANIRAKLTPDEVPIWDQILKAFDAYLSAEAERAQQLYAGGSEAGIAYTSQKTLVREHFIEFVRSSFNDMNLASATKGDLADTQALMNAAYENSLTDYEASYSVSDDPGDKEFNETMSGYVSEYKQDIQNSQERWESLKDLCTKFTVQLYKGKSSTDWASSAGNALALIRIQELHSRPL